MFEFLFAIFSSAYWGGKLLDESSRKKEYSTLRKKYEGITEKLCFPSMTCKPPETRGEFWIMCDSISDDLRYIFGDDWRTRLNFPLIPYYGSICNRINERNMFTHPTNIAYHVWLSKKGYYGTAFMSSGYNYAAFDGVNNPENQALVLRTCQTIEKNLRAVHPDLPLRLFTHPDKPYMLKWEYQFLSVGITPGDRLW